MFGHFVNRELMMAFGDGGGRAANQGGMGGGGSSGSSGGGGGNGGGGLGDGGGRAANQGGMGGSSSSGGSSGGGGGGPGRDTPGAPDAADGRRGASMGPDGGLAGSESISGSGSARSSFSFNARNSAPTMTTFRDSRSVVSPSTQGTFRAAREMTRDRNTMNSVINQDALDAVRSIDRETPRTRGYERAMADRSTVQPATRDVRSRQGMGIIEGNQPEMNTGFLGLPLGGLFALGQNTVAGMKTARELSELENQANLPDSFFPDSAANYARAYSAERLANVPFAGSLIGDTRANEKALLGANPAPEPNLPSDGGGGGDEPYIPPQQQVPPAQQQPQQPTERQPRIGRLRNYNSYARRFFNAT